MLKGVTTTPDDYLCEDGDLAGAIGVESTDGGIEGVSQHGPKVVMKMARNTEQVVFEHKVKPQYNWVVWDSQSKAIGYVKDRTATSAEAQTVTAISGELASDDMPAVEAIGNTLIVRCRKGGKTEMHYVLWKPDMNEYKYLGTHIPEVSIQFGLGIDMVRDWDSYTDSRRTYAVPYHLEGFSEDLEVPNFSIKDLDKAKITSAVMATINKGSHEAMKEGYFTQPFLVRYCMKMYDGSTTMCSAPVYMPVTETNSNISFPLCIVDGVEEDKIWYHSEHVRSRLKYRIINSDAELEDIRDWSDIIKGIDICVSEPIYTYNPAGTVDKTFGYVTTKEEPENWAGTLIEAGNNQIRVYGTLDGKHLIPEDWYTIPVEEIIERRRPYKGWNREYIAIQEFGQAINLPGSDVHFVSDTAGHPINDHMWWGTAADLLEDESIHFAVVCRTPHIIFVLPEKSKADFTEEVKNCSRFYKVSTIEIEGLKGAEQFRDEDNNIVLEDVEIEEGVLNNVSVRPMIEDEFRSHDTIASEVVNVYNARLNLADITRTLWTGFHPEQFLMHYDERNRLNSGELVQESGLIMTFVIKENGREYVVKSLTGKRRKGRYDVFPYFYYTNPNATKLILEIGNEQKHDFRMEEHTGLNGAIHYTGAMNVISEWDAYDGTVPDESETLIIYEQNKIYTSNAENPWIFLPKNVNTVGNDRILGMGAVTAALSQGQHGSFPMYCMTTEGVWSLTVNSTGGWSTTQTVTRDVMVDGTPILLIDDAIIFLSDQGLMMLQADKTVCMTDGQRGKPTVRISKLPGLMKLIRSNTLADFSKLISADATDKEIDETLTSDLTAYMRGKDIGLYYDYTNQRIVMGCYDHDGNDTKAYSWIYYLNRRMWTMAPWKLMNRVNTYPECYAMLEEADGKNYMVKLDTTERDWDDATGDAGKEDDVLMVIRPIKLGEAADMLKELENMTVEGLFDKNKLGLAVWGTRDYKHWHLVGSCKGLHLVRKHGSGYLAFVVAITGKLGQDEYLDSLTMEYQPRFVRKLHGMGYN